MTLLDMVKRRIIERQLKKRGYMVISTPLSYEDWQRVTELWRKCKPEVCVTDEEHAEAVIQELEKRHNDG